MKMDWDDSYDEWDDTSGYKHVNNHMDGIGASGVADSSNDGLYPTDIRNPARAYFLLSDDAQDEITGSDKRRMKYLTCGYRFIGDIYDRCPKCDNLNTEEVLSFIDDEDEAGETHNMKCLDCGHTLVGEIYDRFPECFSSDTEQMTEENEGGYW